jgi:hypothetical protein
MDLIPDYVDVLDKFVLIHVIAGAKTTVRIFDVAVHSARDPGGNPGAFTMHNGKMFVAAVLDF